MRWHQAQFKCSRLLDLIIIQASDYKDCGVTFSITGFEVCGTDHLIHSVTSINLTPNNQNCHKKINIEALKDTLRQLFFDSGPQHPNNILFYVNCLWAALKIAIIGCCEKPFDLCTKNNHDKNDKEIKEVINCKCKVFLDGKSYLHSREEAHDLRDATANS